MTSQTTPRSLIAITVAFAVLAAAPTAGAQVLGKFVPTGSMGQGRDGATATLLPGGKVLVAGGGDAGVPLASAEVYDPSTGKFTAAGPMTTARWNGTATLLPIG